MSELDPIWPALHHFILVETGMNFSHLVAPTAVAALADLATAAGLTRDAYLERTAIDERTREALISRITNGTSWFFREWSGYEALLAAAQRLKKQTGRRDLKVWCAACAHGQEAYSIAMVLLEAGFAPTVLGTDINVESVRRAEIGEYLRGDMLKLPSKYVKYFAPRTHTVGIQPAVRAAVQFQTHSIFPSGRCPTTMPRPDIIMCRHVLMYFDRPAALEIARAMLRATAPHGALILAAIEQSLLLELDANETPSEVAMARAHSASGGPRAATHTGERLRTNSPWPRASTSRVESERRTTDGNPRRPGTNSGERTQSTTSRNAAMLVARPPGRLPTSETAPRGEARESHPRAATRENLPRAATQDSHGPRPDGVARVAPRAATAGSEPLPKPRKRPTTERRARRPSEPPTFIKASASMLSAWAPQEIAEVELAAQDKTNASAQLSLGIIRKQQERYAEACAALRASRFLTRDEHWLAPFQLGVCLERLGDVREAIEAYRHALLVAQNGGSAAPFADEDVDILRSSVMEACRQRLRMLAPQP